MRLGSRDGAVTGDWSKTGGAGEPQPDNREFKVSYESFKNHLWPLHTTDMRRSSANFGYFRLRENMTRPVLLCSTTFMATER